MNEDPRYCPARLAKIVYSEHLQTLELHVAEVDGVRHFAISVGQCELAALVMVLQNAPKVRPMTHDLLLACIAALGGSLKRLNITQLKNGTYFAELVLEADEGDEIVIDCRPSDGMVLAASEKADLFVAEEVFAAES